MGIEKTGDWDKLNRMLSQVGGKLKTNVRRATKQNAEDLIQAVSKAFDRQGPGWKSLKPGYAKAKARKGGHPGILDDTGSMRGKGLSGGVIDWNEGYVSVLRNVPGKGSMVNIAAVHEFGSRNGRIPARPFLMPAAKAWEPGAVKRYEDAVEAAFKD